jgi:diguanylate cyclase (GGDEF)-like protein
LEDTQVGKPPNVPPGHELWKTVVDPEQNEVGGCVQERVEIRNVDHEALDVALTMQLLEDQSGQPCFVLIEALDIGSLAKDELTKLFRREVAIRVLTREIEFRVRDKRMSHQPISVAFADIDDFKGINTRHTDLGGDAVLRKMGKVLQGCARAESKDLICRWYSGDEFLAVIFGDHAAALQVANRMDEGIKASETIFTDASGRTETIKVTASIGVATWEPGDTYEDLVRRAIESKSFSKGAGKGRVTGQMPPLDRTLIDFAAAAKKNR